MREGFPRVVVLGLMCALALFAIGLMAWFSYFLWRPAIASEQFGDLDGLLITAALSGVVCLTSGLLEVHYRSFQSYRSGEQVFFGVFLVISAGILLCSGIWAAMSLVFGG